MAQRTDPNTERLAAIDIGSNSIRYMEAELRASGFGFSRKEVFTTRLAQGLSESGMLSPDRMADALDVLKALSRRAADRGFPCRAYATSAVRDAGNRADFLRRAQADAGLAIDVLSGETEAALAFFGAAQSRGGLIDVGGGSTQVVTSAFSRSFPIGYVRIRDWCGGLSLVEMEKALLPRFLETYVLPPLPGGLWTAVGGTATTLAALSLGLSEYDPSALSRAALTGDALRTLLSALDAMGDAGRRRAPLLAKRHDVILGGGLVLLYLMGSIGIEELRFSDADGLEGYAMTLLEGRSLPAGGEAAPFQKSSQAVLP